MALFWERFWSQSSAYFNECFFNVTKGIDFHPIASGIHHALDDFENILFIEVDEKLFVKTRESFVFLLINISYSLITTLQHDPVVKI